MTCPACTFEQSPDAKFCARCGASFVGTYQPFPPGALEPRTRVAQNLQALGILWCIFGAYRLLRGLMAATFFHAWLHNARFDEPMPLYLAGLDHLIPLFTLTTVFFAGVSVLAGVGLLTRRTWARPLAIVMAILSLLKIPAGTALGIYTLWVLAPRAAGEEWTRLERV